MEYAGSKRGARGKLLREQGPDLLDPAAEPLSGLARVDEVMYSKALRSGEGTTSAGEGGLEFGALRLRIGRLGDLASEGDRDAAFDGERSRFG